MLLVFVCVSESSHRCQNIYLDKRRLSAQIGVSLMTMFVRRREKMEIRVK